MHGSEGFEPTTFHQYNEQWQYIETVMDAYMFIHMYVLQEVLTHQ